MNGANMKKGLFIGFQSEGEPQKDERSVELTQQIKALKKPAEWQTSLEMSEKCPLCHLKMSVPQGKFAIQPKKQLEEQDERNKRLSILLFWAGIVVNAAITIVITIVLHQFGY